MGNVNDTDTGCLQVADDLEQQARFLLGQRGGRLIHDQHFGIKRKRLGDFHHLALRHGKAAHQRIWMDIDTEAIETAFGIGTQLLAVDQETFSRFARKIDVFGNAQMRNEIEFLVNDGDAGGFRFERRGVLDLLALMQDRAAGRLIDAADDLHQRGLASAVLAADGVNFAGAQVETHIAQSLDAGELLADVIEAQKRTGRLKCVMPCVIMARNGRCALRHPLPPNSRSVLPQSASMAAMVRPHFFGGQANL